MGPVSQERRTWVNRKERGVWEEPRSCSLWGRGWQRWRLGQRCGRKWRWVGQGMEGKRKVFLPKRRKRNRDTSAHATWGCCFCGQVRKDPTGAARGGPQRGEGVDTAAQKLLREVFTWGLGGRAGSGQVFLLMMDCVEWRLNAAALSAPPSTPEQPATCVIPEPQVVKSGPRTLSTGVCSPCCRQRRAQSSAFSGCSTDAGRTSLLNG